MDFETARSNMIEQQIRPWNVLEMQTLNALAQIRREDFVPGKYSHLTFVDIQIPLDHDQVMLEPKISARMVEALELQADHDVLVIGTGSGYTTALVAMLCHQVTSIELYPDLSSQAGRNLAMAGIDNVNLICDDCFNYCSEQSGQSPQYDRVLVTGSVPDLSSVFVNLANDQGWVVGIEGADPAMQAMVIKKSSAKTSLFETSVRRLENSTEQPTFDF